MCIEIREDSPSSLAEYASVPIAFVVRERLVLPDPAASLGGLPLVSEPVLAPYEKDYDSVPGEGPNSWASRFDFGNWGILSAWVSAERVGGAAVVRDTSGGEILAGRVDLAILRDLRVAPSWRQRSVGAALFRAAETWALARRAAWLKVETQSVNVPACRFYARQGCVLGAVHQFAYPEFPDEVQLIWYKRIGQSP